MTSENGDRLALCERAVGIAIGESSVSELQIGGVADQVS